MAKLSVCIEAFWKEKSYEERIALSGGLGFKAVEFWAWENKDLDKVKAAADKAGVKVCIFGMSNARSFVDPNGGPVLREGLDGTLAAVEKLGVDRILATVGDERKAESFEVTRRTVVRNLKALAPILEDKGVTMCIEPLNPIVNHLGYWLTRMSDAADICYEVGSPNVTILMDLYHQQITEGNLIANLRQYADLIGHFHCAGVPGRHELVGGELDYRAIFNAIDETGYHGHVGLEFWPEGDTPAALNQAQDLAAG